MNFADLSKAPEAVKQNEHIIMFDGVCNLCEGWTKFVIKRDKAARFKFVSVQSAAGKTILQWLGMPTDDVKTMVYLNKGAPAFESLAFLDIIKQLPWPWSWLSILRYFPACIRNGCYRLIADNRYSMFGRKDACMIPEPSVQQRFLE
jgi:predicted DCC family thiol-disulfide oxidoreductase YuxK